LFALISASTKRIVFAGCTLLSMSPVASSSLPFRFAASSTVSVLAMILDHQKRVDGRDMTTVRPISIEVGLLPRVHGSALFTRGETQAIVTTTLGTGQDEQKIDALIGERWKKVLRDDVTCYGEHHFSVLDQFTNPSSALFRTVLRMMGI